jgi:hypothetical protein
LRQDIGKVNIMRHVTPLLLGMALLAGAPAYAHGRHANPEAQLAEELAGRVAGDPVDCIELHDIRATRIVDHIAIIYETSGKRFYVNRLRGGANALDKWDVLLTETHSSQLCSVDTVKLVDPSTHMQTGFVFLGKFEPYTKADQR